jgi:hypothetical protein
MNRITLLALFCVCACTRQTPEYQQKSAEKTDQVAIQTPTIRLVNKVRIHGENAVLEVYCDASTGNLIYIAHGDYNSANYHSQPIALQVQRQLATCR